MRKGLRLIKRAVALSLVLLLSIESFAAIVSDNDGSAFITKGEFDSLKNSFQNQIDQYNTSIDSKIDGAIAAYLAGVNVSKAPTNLWDSVTTALGQNLKMRNKFDTGTSNSTNSYALSFSRFLDIYEATNFNVALMAATNRDSNNDIRGFWRIETRIGRGSGESSTSQNYAMIDFENKKDASYYGYKSTAYWMTYRDAVKNSQAPSTSPTNTIWKTNNENPTYSYSWRRYSATNAVSSNGTGSRWIYHQNPNGQKYLMSYNPRYGISINGQIYYKTILPQSPWNINGTSAATADDYPPKLVKYMTDKTRSDDTTQTLGARLGGDDVAGSNVVLGIKSSDDGKASYGGGTRNGPSQTTVQTQGTTTSLTDESRSNFWSLNYSVEQTSDNIDYTLDQWGKNTNVTLYTNRDIESPTKGSLKSYDLDRDSFNNVYAGLNGWNKQTNYIGKLTVQFDDATLSATPQAANVFVNTYLSSVAGEAVYIGGGVPIARANGNDNDMTIKGKFKAVSGTGTNDNVKYIISNKQFKNGAVDSASGGSNLASGTIKLNTEWTHVVGCGLNDTIWINFYDDTTDGAVVTIGSLELKQ